MSLPIGKRKQIVNIFVEMLEKEAEQIKAKNHGKLRT